MRFSYPSLYSSQPYSSKPLRVAVVAPSIEPIVEEMGYGGTERVVLSLVANLVKEGHKVTLYASKESSIAGADHVSMGPALRTKSKNIQEMMDKHAVAVENALKHVADNQNKYDVVHSHLGETTYDLGEKLMIPVVTTCHGRLDLDEKQALLMQYPNTMLVSISDAQRFFYDSLFEQKTPKGRQQPNWIATVPNGLLLDKYFAAGENKKPDNNAPLLFLARMTQEKRPDLAIEIARRTGRKLIMAAKIDPADPYFETVVEPLIKENSDLVQFIGEVSESEKPELIRGCLALVASHLWPEPFGLTFIETLATGTPVIAPNMGAYPEILGLDGKVGAICGDKHSMQEVKVGSQAEADFLNQAVAAVETISESNPQNCQARAHKFVGEVMARGYVNTYRLATQNRQDAAALVSSTVFDPMLPVNVGAQMSRLFPTSIETTAINGVEIVEKPALSI